MNSQEGWQDKKQIGALNTTKQGRTKEIKRRQKTTLQQYYRLGDAIACTISLKYNLILKAKQQ